MLRGEALRVPRDAVCFAAKVPERPWVYLGEGKALEVEVREPQVSARAEAVARREASRVVEQTMAELGVVVPVGCHVRVDAENATGTILTNFHGSGKPRQDPAACEVCRVHPDDSAEGAGGPACHCCAMCLSRRCVCGPEAIAMRTKERSREARWVEEDRRAHEDKAKRNPAGAEEFHRSHYAQQAADAERYAAQWAYVENVLSELKHRQHVAGLPMRELQRLGFVSVAPQSVACGETGQERGAPDPSVLSEVSGGTMVIHSQRPDLSRAFSPDTLAALVHNHGVDPATFIAASPTKEELVFGAVN